MDEIVNLIERQTFANDVSLQIPCGCLLEMEAYLSIKLAPLFEIGFRKAGVFIHLLQPFFDDQGVSHKALSPL